MWRGSRVGLLRAWGLALVAFDLCLAAYVLLVLLAR